MIKEKTMTSSVNKLAALLLATAAIATAGVSSTAFAGVRLAKEIRAVERHNDVDRRHFEFEHRFNYIGDCYYVGRPWGIVKICPDLY
jgi:hypothetical protein